jgi:hypothetical protein
MYIDAPELTETINRHYVIFKYLDKNRKLITNL